MILFSYMRHLYFREFYSITSTVDSAYLEVQIWSLLLVRKCCGKEEKLLSPLFHNIFNISLTSGVKLHIHLWNMVVRFIFFYNSANLICRGTVILQYYSPLDFEIVRVDCIGKTWTLAATIIILSIGTDRLEETVLSLISLDFLPIIQQI